MLRKLLIILSTDKVYVALSEAGIDMERINPAFAVLVAMKGVSILKFGRAKDVLLLCNSDCNKKDLYPQ